MGNGFRIEIDTSLTEEEDKVARSLAAYFVDAARPDFSWNRKEAGRVFGSGGGYTSVLKRGTLGLVFGEKKDHQVWFLTANDLVFRRSSRNRRIFTISRPDILERLDGESLQLGICHCGRCEVSQQRVRYKKRPETYTYCEMGEIKG